MVVTVLEQSASRTVVRMEWSDPSSPARRQTLSVAVPGPEGATLRVLDSRSVPPDPRRLGDRQGADQAVAVTPARRFRSQWLVGVDVDPVVGRPATHLTSLTLQLDHPPVDAPGVRARLPEVDAYMYGTWLANPNAAVAFREASRGAAAKRRVDVEDTFAASPNWIRVEVDRTGLYGVTYDDLQLILGRDVDEIRPETVRVLSAKAPAQPILAGNKQGSWKLDYELFERAILVESNGPVLVPGDRIVFYALGPETWTDGFDPTAGPLEHFEHPYADRVAYWITYDRAGEVPGGDFGAPPARVVERDVSPVRTPDRTLDQYRERLHREENLVQAYGVTLDDWAWLQTIRPGIPVSFSLEASNVVPATTGTIRAPAFSRPAIGDSAVQLSIMAASLLGGPELGRVEWTIGSQESPLADPPIYLDVAGVPFTNGTNLVEIANDSPPNAQGRTRELWFDAMSITYRRTLTARSGVLAWSVYEDEVPADETWEFSLTDDAGSWSGDPLVLDVTHPTAAERLVGADVAAGALRLQVDLVAAERRHYVLARTDRLLRPLGLRAHRPRTLRAEVGDEGQGAGYDMVILAPPDLMSAAEDLAAFRSQNLAGRANPRVTAVNLQDVYDQFGHGVKEPAAIRNYLKFLYAVDDRLEFAALIGDASRDYRNRSERDPAGPEIDRFPTFIQTQWPFRPTVYTRRPYAADDWFGSFDDPPPAVNNSRYIDLPDIAIGRLPAGDLTEANRLVQRILAYESTPASGPWRNRLMLVADDEVGLSGPSYNERAHIEEAECVAEELLPSSLDVQKLYLTDYDVVPGTRAKPTARQAMRERWSDGALIVHYIGHGSPEQMADEAVFRIEDVLGLSNGPRLPLFLAFSCDVAIFDSHVSKSMSEQLMLTPGGGAIATIAATQVTFIGPNEELTETFYPALYPSGQLSRSEPIGRALILAKASVPRIDTEFYQHNGQRYVLLGDPALRLRSPTESVQLSGPLSQAIRSGQKTPVSGVVDQLQTSGAGGTYYLDVEEAARDTSFLIEFTNDFLDYRSSGSAFFKGSGEFVDGEATVELVAPSFMHFGPEGRVQLLMESGSEAYVGVVEPDVVRGPIDGTDVEGPTIQLAFAANARTVTAGAILTATLTDASGVNVLGTVPANSIQLEFDDTGIPVDVTNLFQLEAGSFEKGALQYVLPDEIAVGAHTVVLSASDMLNNISQASITFEVQAAGGVDISTHAAFPNPFTDATRFVVEISAPPEIGSELAVTIFTTSGRAVRRLSTVSDGSARQVIGWDGRDSRGDEVANGVYLYTVRATFDMATRVTLTDTGRIVRMR